MSWHTRKERGAAWTMRFMLGVCRVLGDRPVRILLRPIVWYFFLTSWSAARASREFHRRAIGRSSLRLSYRQLMNFAEALVDRVFILMGKTDHYRITPHGRELLVETANKKQGAIILSAHMGNFEAGRALVRYIAGLKIHIVAYHEASKKIRAVLDELNPELSQNVIDPSQPDAVFKMRDIIEQGGLLAILGDRTGFGGKATEAEFLGDTALFPAGPFMLAAILKCPVYLFMGLRTGDHQYDPYVELLSEQVKLPRKGRDAAVAAYVQSYANRLAHYARQHPENWFNFYDFWQKEKTGK